MSRAYYKSTIIGTDNPSSQHREFAEYHHAQKHLPLGTRYVAWSAAADILAHQVVWHDTIPLPVSSYEETVPKN